MSQLRMSSAKAKILDALLSDPEEPHYGYALMRDTGVKSGSLYPILDQLVKVGWLTSTWEEIDESVQGRPPRRLYRLTEDGRDAATAALAGYLAELPSPLATPRPAYGIGT